jgi:predicted amino acid racemase
MNALNFVQNNYDSLINNGIKIHDNWNELEIAWHLIETVGFENTFSLVCGTLSFTIEHGDWILEAANLLEMTGVGVDIADAASTLGLSLLLSGAVWGITKLANGSQEEQLKQLIEENKKIQEIHFMLKKEFPSNEIATRLTNINPILLGR